MFWMLCDLGGIGIWSVGVWVDIECLIHESAGNLQAWKI